MYDPQKENEEIHFWNSNLISSRINRQKKNLSSSGVKVKQSMHLKVPSVKYESRDCTPLNAIVGFSNLLTCR